MRLAVCIAMIALTTVGALLNIGQVGKPKRPTTGGTAALATVFSAAYIWGVIYLYASAS